MELVEAGANLVEKYRGQVVGLHWTHPGPVLLPSLRLVAHQVSPQAGSDGQVHYGVGGHRGDHGRPRLEGGGERSRYDRAGDVTWSTGGLQHLGLVCAMVPASLIA